MQHLLQIQLFHMRLMIKLEKLQGFIKWQVLLGNAFGVAISATVYGAIASISSVDVAATAGIITNVIFAVLSLISIMILVPKHAMVKLINETSKVNIKPAKKYL